MGCSRSARARSRMSAKETRAASWRDECSPSIPSVRSGGGSERCQEPPRKEGRISLTPLGSTSDTDLTLSIKHRLGGRPDRRRDQASPGSQLTAGVVPAASGADDGRPLAEIMLRAPVASRPRSGQPHARFAPGAGLSMPVSTKSNRLRRLTSLASSAPTRAPADLCRHQDPGGPGQGRRGIQIDRAAHPLRRCVFVAKRAPEVSGLDDESRGQTARRPEMSGVRTHGFLLPAVAFSDTATYALIVAAAAMACDR